MIPRTLSHYLKKDALYYPVVTVTGPRQSGKTTLVKSTFPDYEFVSLEEIELRSFARDNPREFLNRYSEQVIIDEVQRVPDILAYLQSAVDEDDAAGRFILTGSHNLLLLGKVSQSLAGRTGILHLLPFSRSELELQIQQVPTGRKTLFNNDSTKLDLWKTVYKGFYPRIHDKNIPPNIWLADYVQTYLERDVRSLINIGDLERFERFLMLAAGRTGQLLNYSSLANDCGISVDTAKRWISVLKTSFVIFLLHPHHQNFNKRIIKSPKLFFYDTGLVCHLLRIRNPEQARTHPLRGALFENLIIAEVAKAYLHNRRRPPLFFWRDKTGHEVDLLIEEAGELFPVEIKSGQTIATDMFDSLKWWCRLADRSYDAAALVYGGDDFRTQDEIRVRPWFSV